MPASLLTGIWMLRSSRACPDRLRGRRLVTFATGADTIVRRPVEEVFAFLGDDVDRFASWRYPSWMQLRRLTDGPVEVGARCETALGIPGVPQGPIVTEVTAYRPDWLRGLEESG